MNCIILGDKYQKGMKSKGCAALTKINKHDNILDNQYKILNKCYNSPSISYIYGFDAKKLLDFVEQNNYLIDMVYNSNYEKHNESFSLSLVWDKLDKETIIIMGHQKITMQMMKKISKNPNDSMVFCSKTDDKNRLGCSINENTITTFNFGLDNQIYSIYYLSRECSVYLRDIVSELDYKNYFLFELLNKIIDKGISIKPILI